MCDSVEINRPKQVLVEGDDDFRVFGSILDCLDIRNVQVQRYRGYPSLRRFLKTFKALSGFESVQSLAIVADADCSRTGREIGIRDALSNMGLPSPPGPLKVASNGNLRVAYLVVPDYQDTGMIEDVCLDSVRPDPAMSCVDDYFECISRTSLPGPKTVRMSKARVHAFLASRERPGLRLGEASQNGVWQFDADGFRSPKALLRML